MAPWFVGSVPADQRGLTVADRVRKKTPSTILVTAQHEVAFPVALRWAARVADAWESSMVVLRVLPADSWAKRIRAPWSASDPLAKSRALGAALDATRALCEQALGPRSAVPPIAVQQGRLVDAVEQATEDFRAGLVVFGAAPAPGDEALDSSRALTAVLDRARTPLLVARTWTRDASASDRPPLSGVLLANGAFEDEMRRAIESSETVLVVPALESL